MTYYMRCKKWAEEQHDEFTAHKIGHWVAWTWLYSADGRTRELACKRLWETLIELGVAEEEVT